MLATFYAASLSFSLCVFCPLGAIKRERSHSLPLFQTLFLSLSPQPSPPLSLNVYYHGPKVVQLR